MTNTKTYPNVRLRALRLVAVTLSLFFTVALPAAEAAKVSFNVPAGEASQTLKQFAQQAKREVMFPAQAVGAARTNAVQGELTVKEGLDRLLAGTELSAIEDAKTGAIMVKGPASPNVQRAARSSDRPAQDKVEGQVVRLDKFEVFGSKSINADLPRTRDDVQPYVVFNREQLESSQAVNLDEFFRARLPMNQNGFSVPNAIFSQVNLRGLGTNQTLILIDGRRIPGRAIAQQGDLNGIPLGMIERIEILPATASGIYGGGATGGVINIITRKDYSGVEVRASYLNTFDTDASTRRIELNASYQLEGGKTLLTLNASRTDGTSLLTQDRDLVQRGRALQLANNPAAFYGVTSPPVGYTTNIRNQTGANLVLKPQYGGANLGSPITFVPVGYTGIASDNAAALVANAGKYNLELGNIVTGRLGNLRPADPRQESYGFSLRRMFGARVELLVDASRFFNLGQTVIGGVSTPFTLAANAPNNPFTTAVNIGFPATELSRTGESKTTADRLLAGVIVRLPAEWTAGADYVWSQSRTNGRTPQAYLGDPDGTGPGISYATALATGVLDVLRDLNRYPLDYSPYAMPDPFAYSNFLMRTDEVTARASGPIYALPAGKVVLSASAQFRWEDLPSSIGSTPPSSGTTPTYSWQPGVKLDARAYYAEVQVPVFAQTKPSGLRRGLDLQASVRRDEIDARVRASGSFITIPSPAGPFPDVAYLDRKWKATKATVGFKYAPLPDVTLRASWGSGFLAPALNQLSSTGPTVSQFLLTDPKRGNIQTLTTVTAYQSGSPSLQPEESESISAGLILTPRFWPGFRFSLDYTRIEKTDEIGNLSNDLLFRYEDRLPGRIVRAPLTPADQALGYTGGVIQVIDFRTLNIAGKRLTAYDLAADYTRKVAGWGEFNAYAAATYQPDFSTKPFPDVDYIQTAGGLGVVKWRGNGGITWTRGPLSLGWNMQYYHSYLIYTPGTAATTVATLVLNQGSPTIPSQVYHDLLATYRFGAETTGWRRYLAHTRLSVGVQNFLNTRPPPVATTAGNSAGFSSIGDPRLARYTLTVRKTF